MYCPVYYGENVFGSGFSFRCCTLSKEWSWKRETHDAKISALPLRLVSSNLARRLYFPCCLCLFFFLPELGTTRTPQKAWTTFYRQKNVTRFFRQFSDWIQTNERKTEWQQSAKYLDALAVGKCVRSRYHNTCCLLGSRYLKHTQ